MSLVVKHRLRRVHPNHEPVQTLSKAFVTELLV